MSKSTRGKPKTKASRITGRRSSKSGSTTESAPYHIRVAATFKRLREWFLCVLSGVLIFTSYPKFDQFYLQWFALVPVLWVIRHKPPRAAFAWGLWTGLVTNLGGFYWITGMLQDFGHFSLAAAIPLCVLLCAYQGLVPAIWAGLTRWLEIRSGASLLLIAPVVWVTVEYLLPFIFPWYLANGQYLFYPAIQIVEITGVLGLSWLLVFVNIGLFRGLDLLIRQRYSLAWRPVALALTLFILNVGYGSWRIEAVDQEMATAPSLKIGVGEANVGIFEKEAKSLSSGQERLWMLRGNVMKHHLLAAELEEKHAVDLIVEPESSFIPIPYPYGTVRFKRTDLFAAAVSNSARIWELHGDSWESSAEFGDDTVLRGISAAREDYLVAVGNDGAVYTKRDGPWTAEDSGTDNHLRAVWSGEYDDSFARVDGAPIVAVAVGDKGTVVMSQAGPWRSTPTGTTVRLNAVDGKSHDDVLAVGGKGTILRWQGDQWTRQATNTTVDLHGVNISATGTRYAVGDQGLLLVYKSGRWQKQRLGESRLRAIDSSGSKTIIGGDGGSLYISHGKGRPFKRQRSPTKSTIRDVAFDGTDSIWAVGDNGLLLHKSPSSPAWVKEQQGPRERLVGVSGVPFTEAHAYARDARYLYRSNAPLPTVSDRMRAVDNINELLPDDRKTSLHAWNTPLRGFNTPILMGLLTYEPKPGTVSATLQGKASRRTYNSAMLVDEKGHVLGRYDKNYLLVFGEYIPLGSTFPEFYEWLPEASHFEPGTTVETFEFKGFQLGVMICYEDIIPRFTRRLAGKDPNVLINVTNDAWFGKTSEPYLHLALAIFRAVENRLWLIRSTNTGVSAYVDAVGRLVAQTRLDDPELLVEDVPMMSSTTPYREYGDLFGYACIVAFLLLTVVGFIRRRV